MIWSIRLLRFKRIRDIEELKVLIIRQGMVQEFCFRFLMSLFCYREFQFRKKGNMVLG